MTNTGNNTVPRNDEAVERLLSQAPPRLTPPDAIKLQAKNALAKEWRQVTRRRRTWKFAAAASILVLATASMTSLFVPQAAPVRVAEIDSSKGEISLLNEQGVVMRDATPQYFDSGQTLMTSADSAVGLAWGLGGSLRLDANTTVKFIAADQIELRAGRVYFDSNSSDPGEQLLLIHTDYGDVRHLGTQFMTHVGRSDLLTVSVREGSVSVDGLFYDKQVEVGEQIVFHGDRAPQRTRLAAHSPEWRWVEAVAPMMSMEGKSFNQILEWVAQETGLSFSFDNEAAKTVAGKPLTGVTGKEPLSVLKVGALATGLSFQIIDGVIVIRKTGT